MIKSPFHKSFAALLLLLCLYSCRHQHKEVVAVQKQAPKKPSVAQNKPAEKAPVKNSPGGSELQQKLGISSKQIQENKLYSFIDDWYGVPYKYGGCQKAGVDCSCFTNLLYEKVYDKRIARSAAEMFRACDEISLDQAKMGDLVFFKIGGNSISHVGVFLKNKLFVHASNSRGVIINSLDEAYYKKYFFCAGKMKNV